jgi:hypothetical protein
MILKRSVPPARSYCSRFLDPELGGWPSIAGCENVVKIFFLSCSVGLVDRKASASLLPARVVVRRKQDFPSRSGQRRRSRCCTTTCCHSSRGSICPGPRVVRQRPRVLRRRAPSLRALSGAQRHRAPHDRVGSPRTTASLNVLTAPCSTGLPANDVPEAVRVGRGN